MVKEIIVVTQDGCSACAKLKREMPDLKYVDVGDSRVGELADKLGVGYVPAIILVDGDRICLLDWDLQPVKCVRSKL